MKVVFASCAKIQDFPIQPAWKQIQDEEPDLLILLGDNVYAPNSGLDLSQLELRYQQQLDEPNFKALIEQVPFKAIWDDHDFGPDNAKGAELDESYKVAARDLFHRYMNSSTNLPEAYYSFEQSGVQFIMLDVRYYRENRIDGENATPLGATQLQWFKEEMAKDAEYRIVCSGSCLTRVKLIQNEYLAQYKNFYNNDFLPLLEASKRLLVLTGDVHRNFIKVHSGFYELISSGVGRGGVFSERIRNNYGIIEFKNDEVLVKLKGKRKKDRIRMTIDASSWSSRLHG